MSPRKKTSLVAAASALAFGLVLQTSASDVATKGAELGKWTMDYEAALKLAGEKNLPLLLNFTGSDWCGWCKLMDESVFAKPAWQAYSAKSLVTVTVDFPKNSKIVPQEFAARNQKLQEQHQVEGYPTYLIIDSDGKTELGRLGAGEDKTPESFIAELNDVLRFRPANVEAKVSELGPEKGAKYRAAIEVIRKAEKTLVDWKDSQPKRSPENDAKFKDLLTKIRLAQIEPKAVELDAEKAQAYRAAFQDQLKAEQALEDWVATGPAQNEANDKKFEAFQAKIDAAKKKVDAF